MAAYVSFSELENNLKYWPANTPETPITIVITSMSQYEFSNVTDSSVTTINAVLKRNPSKYVDITVADTCECCTKSIDRLKEIFMDCTSLVRCDISNVIGEGEGQTLDRTFVGCTSLKQFKLPSKTKHLIETFKGCTGLKKFISITSFGIKNAERAFEGCTSLTDVEIDCESDGYYGSMFENCTSLTNIRIQSLTTGNFECSRMFSGCTSLSRVNTSIFRYCKNLSDMFSGCSALTEIDTSNFGAAENINGIFQGCSSLTEIDATPFENVTKAQRAFAGTGITSIDISSMKSVTYAESMFENCAGLTEIHGWNLPRDAAIDNIFKGCSSLEAVHVIEAPPVDSGEWHLIHARVSPDGSTADIDIHSDGGEKTTVTGVSLADGAYGVEFPVAVDDLYVGDGTDLSEKIQEYLSKRYPWSTSQQTDALDASKKNFVLWSRDRAAAKTNITTDVVEAGNLLPPTSAAVQAAIRDAMPDFENFVKDYMQLGELEPFTINAGKNNVVTVPQDGFIFVNMDLSAYASSNIKYAVYVNDIPFEVGSADVTTSYGNYAGSATIPVCKGDHIYLYSKNGSKTGLSSYARFYVNRESIS